MPYHYTNRWFDINAKNAWDKMIPKLKPKKILEVGSYEGASACYLIENISADHDCEIHCVDSWEGGVEHKPGGQGEVDMQSVEDRFNSNIEFARKYHGDRVKLVKHKGLSDFQLAKLIVEGHENSFDFVYIDGSHQAVDVLCDAVLGFKLLRLGGVMAFDDYIWEENLPGGPDASRCPKPAIDAFTNIYFKKIKILNTPISQLYLQKRAN
ncbi:MAG: class I SAM-dependent methyltransferase [Sneathiella sp.]|nr:class I SAM-dependent methyltransferase [Sneathiella sp.]